MMDAKANLERRLKDWVNERLLGERLVVTVVEDEDEVEKYELRLHAPECDRFLRVTYLYEQREAHGVNETSGDGGGLLVDVTDS